MVLKYLIFHNLFIHTLIYKKTNTIPKRMTYFMFRIITYHNIIITKSSWENSLMKAHVKISSKLLEEFDKILQDRGYESRSKGIRDAIKDYILRYQWINEIEGEKFGIISVIYDHHFVGAREDLTNIQHKYREYIDAAMHVHLSKKQYLEVIIVKGDLDAIQKLKKKIMNLKGVKHVKLTSMGIK